MLMEKEEGTCKWGADRLFKDLSVVTSEDGTFGETVQALKISGGIVLRTILYETDENGNRLNTCSQVFVPGGTFSEIKDEYGKVVSRPDK